MRTLLAALVLLASCAALHQPRAVDINTATVDELVTLPGVDRTAADRIIAHRPFYKASELVDRNVVDQSTYAGIAPRIVVGPPAMPEHLENVPRMPNSP